MKIDWKRKLTSRKLWVAVALFVSGLVAHWCGQAVAEKVAGDIMQGAAVLGYILGEGLVDAANKPAASQPSVTQETTATETQTSAIGFESEPVYNTEGEGL